MPVERARVRRSERLRVCFDTYRKLPMATQPTQKSIRARGRSTPTRGMRGRGQAASSIAGTDIDIVDAGVESSGIKIRWETNGQRTDALVQFLSTHPADYRILFNEGGKRPDSEGCPSGSDKTKIHAVIAWHVFENDDEYSVLYSGSQLHQEIHTFLDVPLCGLIYT
ncbi:hypothetical protein BDR07DRAFT_1486177 [Suillus spraguei]|nr:hypothetical protein BDR07DRAFT_1486177 [Suillus spraguei]